MSREPVLEPVCPVPRSQYERIVLAHGGGGRLTSRLIEGLFVPTFANPYLSRQHDGAVVDLQGTRIAFSTDSYVVRPLFFPGGDIGSLAVNGTVNDLAMCGARPQFLSCGLIIEEGLAIEDLRRIVASMQAAAARAEVLLVTGDTKVVERGKGDGLFINTAGIGAVESAAQIGPEQVRPGDAVIISGDIGRHGVAIMAEREGLEFETQVTSDCAPLAAPVLALLAAGLQIHCLRDLTRGGLASALVEIAESAHMTVQLQERQIPVCEQVRGACEILGLDPLYVANEGRFVALLPGAQVPLALRVLQAHPDSAGAALIGTVGESGPGSVALCSAIGGQRLIDRLSGEQLPRIC